MMLRRDHGNEHHGSLKFLCEYKILLKSTWSELKEHIAHMDQNGSEINKRDCCGFGMLA